MSDHDSNEKTNDTLPSTGFSPLSRIGPVALDCAEEIERVYGPDAKVLAVVVVAEVLAPVGEGETLEFINSVEFASSEQRRWVQLALLNEAAAKAEELNEARIAAVEDALEDND